MMNISSELFTHEMESLLEALRRDLRAELFKSYEDTPNADIHRQNARIAVRLLEVLNPRGPHRSTYKLEKLAA